MALCLLSSKQNTILFHSIFKNENRKLFVLTFLLTYLCFFRYINGKAIKLANRIRSTHDFGYVSLDILNAYTEDSGTYMCKAVNQLGEAVNTCSVEITSGQSLLMDSQHPEGIYLFIFI